MLRPAQLYEAELQEENLKSWYAPENIYWDGGPGNSGIELYDNNHESHQFVSIDRDDNILGYIGYRVDWETMSANNFGIISYKKNSLEFARDLYTVICNLFFKYHMNRIFWCAYADNPAIRGYRNFIKKHGGRECGYHRQAARLQDGLLHDSVEFEILAEEFQAKKCHHQDRNPLNTQVRESRIRKKLFYTLISRHGSAIAVERCGFEMEIHEMKFYAYVDNSNEVYIIDPRTGLFVYSYLDESEQCITDFELVTTAKMKFEGLQKKIKAFKECVETQEYSERVSEFEKYKKLAQSQKDAYHGME